MNDKLIHIIARPKRVSKREAALRWAASRMKEGLPVVYLAIEPAPAEVLDLWGKWSGAWPPAVSPLPRGGAARYGAWRCGGWTVRRAVAQSITCPPWSRAKASARSRAAKASRP